jgi:hypothetical protein
MQKIVKIARTIRRMKTKRLIEIRKERTNDEN